MKELKKIYKYYLKKLAFKRWEKYHAQSLNKFHNKYKGKDCFIIGNGPSLNKIKLSRLDKYYTFGLNKIYLIFPKNPFKLDFLVAVNKLVIKQSREEIRKMNVPKFISYMPGKKYLRHSDNTYFLGDLNSKEKFYKNITEGLSQGYTVTYAAMQIAYYMGFERVFLIGVDHNFKQTGKPNEKQVMKGNDSNHFDPNYFKAQQWQLADLENSEIYYLIAKYYFEKDGRKIYDATIDGKLDIFEKIPLEEAMRIAKKVSKQ